MIAFPIIGAILMLLAIGAIPDWWRDSRQLARINNGTNREDI